MLAANVLIDAHGRYAAGKALMLAMDNVQRCDENAENYWLAVADVVMSIQDIHHKITAVAGGRPRPPPP